MENIKKCPFCGGEILIDEEMSQVDEKTKVYRFCCNDCYSVTYFACCNEEEAIQAWNNRVTEAELRANVIDEFYDTVLNFEDYIEPIEERNGVLLYSGRDITNMIADIKRKLKGEKE